MSQQATQSGIGRREARPRGLRFLIDCVSVSRLSPLSGLLAACVLLTAHPASAERAITALGRLEPEGGVVCIAGPSTMAVVISELMVEEGDVLEAGQLIARLDSYPRDRALVERERARVEDAEQEFARSQQLHAGRAASSSARQEAQIALKVARAEFAAAEAQLALSQVRAPSAGQVLRVHAHAGERVGPEGILELGRTDAMIAVAEVYETDIGRVKVGQRAKVMSPALPAALSGTVARIGLMVAKNDVLGTDPVAKTDARVVEVDIHLDAGQDVEALTYLQVTVEIEP